MSPSSLPVIDISPFISPSSSAVSCQTTASDIASACSTHGFFYLTGHGIPPSTTSRILDLARTFFQTASSEAKATIQRKSVEEGGDGARGYQCVGENVTGGKQDWHEAIDFYAPWGGADEKDVGGQEGVLMGENRWPKEPAELEEVYKGYVEEVKRVGTAVVRAMGAGLKKVLEKEGVGNVDPEIFVQRSRDSFWVMRMIGYPPLPANKDQASNGNDAEQYSCGTHTDYGCITLLLADDTPNALQVQQKDASWIYANPIPGAFVVNIGDFMESWTGGRWKSTKHRVIHRSERFRVSVPFFFEPSWDAPATEVGKECQDEKTYGQHLVSKVQTNFY